MKMLQKLHDLEDLLCHTIACWLLFESRCRNDVRVIIEWGIQRIWLLSTSFKRKWNLVQKFDNLEMRFSG